MKNVTDAQIKEWKEKYGSVYLLEVDDKSCYVKAPSRNDLSYASAVSSNGKDAMKFSEALLRNCWIEGDNEIQTNDRLFLAAASQLDKIIEVAEAKIKKL